MSESIDFETYLVHSTAIGKMKLPQSLWNIEDVYDAVMDISKDGMTMDYIEGGSFVHHYKCLEEVYKAIIIGAEAHLKSIGIGDNLKNLQLNVVKSWFNILEPGSVSNPRHNHAEAHLSFTFYPQVPLSLEATRVLYFWKNGYFDPNNLYPGFIEQVGDPTQSSSDQRTRNWFAQMPVTGDVHYFPAGLDHETVANGSMTEYRDTPTRVENRDDLKNMRICIGGDILITAKKDFQNPRVLMPIETWRTFETE